MKTNTRITAWLAVALISAMWLKLYKEPQSKKP